MAVGSEWSFGNRLANRTRALGSRIGARAGAMAAAARPIGRGGFRRTAVGLAGAAFLAPFSATHIAGPVTVGRLAALAFGTMLMIDLVLERPVRFRLDLPSLLLIAGYVGMTAWIYVNKAAWGCNCYGKAGGFVEFAAIGLLSLVAIGFEPRLRSLALLAALSGLVLAALLALAGVGAINSSTVDLTRTGGRLSGTFGNANELGFAVALGLVIALGYLRVAARGLTRIALGAATVVLVVTLALTYSRGAILAAGVGVLALALEWAWGSRRRVRLVLGGAVILVALGAILYSVFAKTREEASFESVPPSLSGLSQRDESGWDRRHRGRSRTAHRGSPTTVRLSSFAAPTPGRASASAGVKRAPVGRTQFDPGQDGGRPASVQARPRRRDPIRLRGGSLRHPRTRMAPVLALVATSDQVSPCLPLHVAARRSRDIRIPGRAHPGRSTGWGGARHRATAQARGLDLWAAGQHRDQGRKAISAIAARRGPGDDRCLRLPAFAGIGWATFPAYTATHLNYGQLAAHDQYLAVAAELGVVGLILLGLLIAAVAIGARNRWPGPADTAAFAVVITTAAGMFFVEPLPVPQTSIPIALAAAVLCAPRRSKLR